MEDFILIFITIFTILNISTRLTRNIKFNLVHIVILGGKIFSISYLFIIPIFILLNFNTDFEELMDNCISFFIALLVTSFLSIPIAVLLNKFDPLTKKLTSKNLEQKV